MSKKLFQKILPKIPYFFLFILLTSLLVSALLLIFPRIKQTKAEGEPVITSFDIDTSNPDVCKIVNGIRTCKSGQKITFTANASSSDNSDLYLFVCKRILVAYGTCFHCEPGDTSNCWAVSTEEQKSKTNPIAVYDSSTATSSPCEYISPKTVHAKVCKGLESGALCSDIRELGE